MTSLLASHGDGSRDIIVDPAIVQKALEAKKNDAADRADALDFTILQRARLNVRLYLVFGASGEQKEVEALTAGEAIEKSGVPFPTKVQQRFLRMPDVIDGKDLENFGRVRM
ncbi:MAG: hypothetical protein ABW189_01870 [Rickettsiales bacterium]